MPGAFGVGSGEESGEAEEEDEEGIDTVRFQTKTKKTIPQLRFDCAPKIYHITVGPQNTGFTTFAKENDFFSFSMINFFHIYLGQQDSSVIAC